MNHLFIFQIGPVQAFIAQARRTQDLYVGSKMLSEIAAKGVIAAAETPGFVPVFPVPTPASAPHRFAFLSERDPYEVAEQVWSAISHTWQTQFVEQVQTWLRRYVGPGDWEAVFERQTRDWPEFHWVAVEYTGPHDKVYRQASRLLAARRTSREFSPIDEPGWKCSLTGAGSALPLAGFGASRRELQTAWDQLREQVGEIVLRSGEMLGALATIKRFAGEHHANCSLNVESFPSTDHIAGIAQRGEVEGKDTSAYLAVLALDGDRMGRRVSECKSLEDHQQFSAALAKFADESVPAIIKKHSTEKSQTALIYAGGDDVLALLPVDVALKCADELRTEFEKLTQCKCSAGIAITPHDLPLDNALQMARAAEKKAKEQYGRNAICVVEAHGTGQQRWAGMPWNLLKHVELAKGYLGKKEISGKLAYDLSLLAHDMVSDDVARDRDLRPAREAEVKRLISRRLAEVLPKDQQASLVEELHPALIELGEHEQCGWEEMSNWMILARFLDGGAA